MLNTHLYIVLHFTVKPGYIAPIGLAMFYSEKPGCRHDQYYGAGLLAEAEIRSAVNTYTVSLWLKL